MISLRAESVVRFAALNAWYLSARGAVHSSRRAFLRLPRDWSLRTLPKSVKRPLASNAERLDPEHEAREVPRSSSWGAVEEALEEIRSFFQYHLRKDNDRQVLEGLKRLRRKQVTVPPDILLGVLPMLAKTHNFKLLSELLGRPDMGDAVSWRLLLDVARKLVLQKSTSSPSPKGHRKRVVERILEICDARRNEVGFLAVPVEKRLLDNFVEWKFHESAEPLFQRLRLMGKASVRQWNGMLDLYSRKGTKELLELFEELESASRDLGEDRVVPDRRSIEIVVQHFANQNQIEAALEWFYKKPSMPSLYLVQTMLHRVGGYTEHKVLKLLQHVRDSHEREIAALGGSHDEKRERIKLQRELIRLLPIEIHEAARSGGKNLLEINRMLLEEIQEIYGLFDRKKRGELSNEEQELLQFRRVSFGNCLNQMVHAALMIREPHQCWILLRAIYEEWMSASSSGARERYEDHQPFLTIPVSCFDKLLHSVIQNRHWDRALAMFEYLQKNELHVDTRIVNKLIRMTSQRHGFDRAMTIFHLHGAENAEAAPGEALGQEMQLDTHAYNIMIRAAAAEGRAHDALELFNMVAVEKFGRNVDTYNSLIMAYNSCIENDIKNGDLSRQGRYGTDAIQNLIPLMRKERLEPTPKTYHGLLQSLLLVADQSIDNSLRSSAYARAEVIFDEFRDLFVSNRTAHITGTPSGYACMMQIAHKEGSLEHVIDLFDEFQSIHEDVRHILRDQEPGYSEIGDWGFQSEDPSLVYETYVRILADRQETDRLYAHVQRMKETDKDVHGLEPGACQRLYGQRIPRRVAAWWSQSPACSTSTLRSALRMPGVPHDEREELVKEVLLKSSRGYSTMSTQKRPANALVMMPKWRAVLNELLSIGYADAAKHLLYLVADAEEMTPFQTTKKRLSSSTDADEYHPMLYLPRAYLLSWMGLQIFLLDVIEHLVSRPEERSRYFGNDKLVPLMPIHRTWADLAAGGFYILTMKDPHAGFLPKAQEMVFWINSFGIEGLAAFMCEQSGSIAGDETPDPRLLFVHVDIQKLRSADLRSHFRNIEDMICDAALTEVLESKEHFQYAAKNFHESGWAPF